MESREKEEGWRPERRKPRPAEVSLGSQGRASGDVYSDRLLNEVDVRRLLGPGRCSSNAPQIAVGLVTTADTSSNYRFFIEPNGGAIAVRHAWEVIGNFLGYSRARRLVHTPEGPDVHEA